MVKRQYKLMLFCRRFGNIPLAEAEERYHAMLEEPAMAA